MWNEEIFILLVLAIPSYFFSKWIINKCTINKYFQPIITWTATFVLTLSLYLMVIVIWVYASLYYPSREFSVKQWNNDKDKRFEVSEDIIERQLLIGKTKKEVIALLGNEKYISSDDEWQYYLGFAPSFSVDADILVIIFENGRVIKVYQRST